MFALLVFQSCLPMADISLTAKSGCCRSASYSFNASTRLIYPQCQLRSAIGHFSLGPIAKFVIWRFCRYQHFLLPMPSHCLPSNNCVVSLQLGVGSPFTSNSYASCRFDGQPTGQLKGCTQQAAAECKTVAWGCQPATEVLLLAGPSGGKKKDSQNNLLLQQCIQWDTMTNIL